MKGKTREALRKKLPAGQLGPAFRAVFFVISESSF